jgi:pilus assembly protein CpaF
VSNSVWKLLDEVAKKEGITEVIINRSDSVFVEHHGELVKLSAQLKPEDIQAFVLEVAQKNQKIFDEDHPFFDGILPDGSRINVIGQVYVQDGPAITIRRYRKDINIFDDKPEVFGLSVKWIQFFKICVKAKLNILVAGGTGSGKTTLLNLLLQEISSLERVITIEDTRELNFKLPNVVHLEARHAAFSSTKSLSMRDLLKNSLRMRPDRIIIGEVRGAEAFDLLQAMNTGHDGSMASIHGSGTGECLSRLENLFLMSGHEIPLRAIRHQISQAIDFIIQVKRLRDGSRVISQLTEVSGMEGERILLQDIGVMKENKLSFTGMAPRNMQKMIAAGLPSDFFVTL